VDHNGFIRRTARSAIALCSTVGAFVLIAPSAYAMTLPPPDGGSPTASPPRPTVAHAVVNSGLAAWQIALVCVGAVLSAAISAALIYWARAAHGRGTVSAA
jgi:hypothetical protein